jgi:hypothetical protein
MLEVVSITTLCNVGEEENCSSLRIVVTRCDLDCTYSTLSASLISSSVLWRMKTGLPRHLMITFLPSGIVERSISTLAWARTSADAAMLTRKSRVSVLALFSSSSALNRRVGAVRSFKSNSPLGYRLSLTLHSSLGTSRS